MDRKAETIRIRKDVKNMGLYIQIRYVPEGQVYRSRILRWIYSRDSERLKEFISKMIKMKGWASFQEDRGGRVEFNNEKKATAWINRKAKLEYRDHLGVVKWG